MRSSSGVPGAGLPLLFSLPCRRIPLEEVPEDEDECSAWLHRLYQEKVSAEAGPTHPFPGAPWVHGGPLGVGGGGKPFPTGWDLVPQLLTILELTLYSAIGIRT